MFSNPLNISMPIVIKGTCSIPAKSIAIMVFNQLFLAFVNMQM